MAKQLNEYGNQWILKRPAPFKIEPAGGYTADMTPQLKQSFLLQRQEEAEKNYNKAEAVARIEAIQPYIVDVYDSIASAREFLATQAQFPGLSMKMQDRINTLVKKLDSLNMVVSTKLLDSLDELTNEVNADDKTAEGTPTFSDALAI